MSILKPVLERLKKQRRITIFADKVQDQADYKSLLGRAVSRTRRRITITFRCNFHCSFKRQPRDWTCLGIATNLRRSVASYHCSETISDGLVERAALDVRMHPCILRRSTQVVGSNLNALVAPVAAYNPSFKLLRPTRQSDSLSIEVLPSN